MPPDNDAITRFFDHKRWTPFPFQHETWSAYEAGRSGLLHAPTGTGKTLAVFLAPILEYLNETNGAKLPRSSPSPLEGEGGRARARSGEGHKKHASAASDPLSTRSSAPPLAVLWITPLRALATDTLQSLREPIDFLNLPWTVEKRTGDTPASLKAKQRTRLPTTLITTPESLSLILSYPNARELLLTLRCVIVDEWHELLSTKRGTQTELALARLRRWCPDLRTWGLSATLANLDEARDTLLGNPVPPDAALISAPLPKTTRIDTVIPDSLIRFPWSGHLGTNLIEPVLDALDTATSTLLFTNTRSQAELWFRALTRARPDWLGRIALHHGSLDRDVRTRVEDHLRAGALRCVVCTSSLDLGVDFSPVDQVIQVGSPKGIARLLQRAGRSGHQPGATSRVLCVPAHALELVEFAAARRAADARKVEPRKPLTKPLDVLVQHLVTVAAGGGFTEQGLLDEVRTTRAFQDISSTEFHWCLDFVTRGGAALNAYPQYHKVTRPDTDAPYTISNDQIAKLHRLAIGTISSDTTMSVRFLGGSRLGAIEESFISRLAPGDTFIFASRTLQLVRVRDMTAHVRLARRKSGFVPRWQGGRSPLSTLLAESVRAMLDEARANNPHPDPEIRAVKPLLDLQQRWSILPAPDQLLIETTRTRTAHHTFLFPFEGRLVHEGLASLLAHRIAALRPVTIAATVNDYAIELLSNEPLDLDEPAFRALLSTEDLLPDLLTCLNSSELARRRFRDIARIAGLIHPGFPGKAAKRTRHIQASSELFFDVFDQFDPANLLLDQARREVLDQQLEVVRLRAALERARDQAFTIIQADHLTPLAFPVWAESLRTQHVSSERWEDRIRRMADSLENAAATPARTRKINRERNHARTRR